MRQYVHNLLVDCQLLHDILYIIYKINDTLHDYVLQFESLIHSNGKSKIKTQIWREKHKDNHRPYSRV